MNIPIYQVDAFTSELFGGNAASICPLDHWLDPIVMQKIAMENNQSETAFFVKNGDSYEIRWFMPHDEIDLCGHATLASAFVIFNFLDQLSTEVNFSSQSGTLKAKREKEGKITLDFPLREPKPIEIPSEVFDAFNYSPLEAYAHRDLVLLYENEQQIQQLTYDLKPLKDLPYLCIIPTAEGHSPYDFVSRVFDANAPMEEDPVTGSAHTVLAPYWEKRLGKSILNAKQLSDRGGEILCQIEKDRVYLTGNAVLYMKGTINI